MPRKTPTPSGDSGRFAYDGLDRTLHEKARLSILTSLITRPEGLLFSELRDLCALTDGNLSRHLEVLREGELVEVWKGYAGRRPQTLVRLTAAGRERFVDYLSELQKVLVDAKSAAESAGETAADSRKRPLRDDLDFSFNPV